MKGTEPMKRTLSFALLAMSLAFSVSAQNRGRGDEDNWDNAPKVVPNTTEEMQHAEFWINRLDNPDKVVMTKAQIEKMNKRNQSLPPKIKDINGDDYDIDRVIQSKLSIGLQYNVEQPLKITSFPGDSLRAMMGYHKELLTGRTKYDVRQMKYDEDEINRLIGLMNEDAIPLTVTPRYGILVKHTLNRAVPTMKPGYGRPQSWLDNFQSTALDLGSPVAILHTSPDGDWFYVRSEIAFGWIIAENVAIGSAKDIADYLNTDKVVVSLDYNVPIYGDSSCKNFYNYLMIGANVRLDSETSNTYKVIMPIRKPDGTFATAPAWVKKDAKMSNGYQPFTQRNIISTMFNLLYRPYGWADSYDEFDCCGLIRVVLRTFGIKTGRWTSYELHATDNVVAFPRKTPNEEKYAVLKECEPGICLVGSAGHINMYLGEVNGSYYVIHQGGYSYKVDDTTYHFRRVNVNDTELSGGSNISGWSEISQIKP